MPATENAPPESAHLTTVEVAAKLRVGPRTVQSWLAAGRLHGSWFGRRVGWRIPAAEVDRFLAEGIGSRDGCS